MHHNNQVKCYFCFWYWGDLTIACREAAEKMPIFPRIALVGLEIEPKRDCNNFDHEWMQIGSDCTIINSSYLDVL